MQKRWLRPWLNSPLLVILEKNYLSLTLSAKKDTYMKYLPFERGPLCLRAHQYADQTGKLCHAHSALVQPPCLERES